MRGIIVIIIATSSSSSSSSTCSQFFTIILSQISWPEFCLFSFSVWSLYSIGYLSKGSSNIICFSRFSTCWRVLCAIRTAEIADDSFHVHPNSLRTDSLILLIYNAFTILLYTYICKASILLWFCCSFIVQP